MKMTHSSASMIDTTSLISWFDRQDQQGEVGQRQQRQAEDEQLVARMPDADRGRRMVHRRMVARRRSCSRPHGDYPAPVTRPRIPDEVLSAAHARSRARAERDWAEADRLRAEIEAAGWKVVDRGTDFALTPGDRRRTSRGTAGPLRRQRQRPIRLDEPPTGLATVVLLATDWPDDLARTLAGLRATRRRGRRVVVVARRARRTSRPRP